MFETAGRERRTRPPAASMSARCRLCWRAIALERRHIDRTDLHVYVRCPHCGSSFPIRHVDFDLLVRAEQSV